MSLPRPRLVLSALKGGAGKTCLPIGLAAAWKRLGLKVVPFKKGPDYIEAGWLSRAAGHVCRNLDPYLVDWPVLRRHFLEKTRGDQIALIEGNRGLFDGMDAAGSTSTAELAKRLEAPVVLVLDCTKATRTLAALFLGCRQFDPAVNLAGVILNQLAGARHERIVSQPLQGLGCKIFGAVPRFELKLPERHLGLIPAQEHPQVSDTPG